MYTLVEKVIKSNNLDTREVLDTCFALCMADKFVGTNRLELSVDKFVCSDSEDWSSILELLGVSTNVGVPLPKVQQYRVITDALVICCKNTEDGVFLTSEASQRVARLKGLSIRSSEYHDIKDVEAVLQRLCVVTNGFDKIHELESTLQEYEKDCTSWGYNFGSIVRTGLRGVKLPGKFVYIENGDTDIIDEDIMYGYICDLVMFALEYDFFKTLRDGIAKNEVLTNLFINRAMKEIGNVSMGVVSFESKVPRIEFEAGLPSYMREKMLTMFNRNMCFDIQDIDNILLLQKHLYTGKVR